MKYIWNFLVVALIAAPVWYGYTFYQELRFESKVLEGHCPNCGRHNTVAKKHTVWYAKGKGVCLLCESCWNKLDTEDRLYWHLKYVRMVEKVGYDEEGLRDMMIKAVK